MFTGRDCHHVFEETCKELARGELDLGVIRRAFFVSAVLIVLTLIGLARYLAGAQASQSARRGSAAGTV
jgi:hypothetical protein